MNLVGELAALATSLFFAITALIFTQTGRMVGSQITNQIRLTFALLYLVIINLIFFREPLPLLALGALNGPLLSVSASLLAVQHAQVGVASGPMALPPMIILPISYFVFKETIGWQGMLGTMLAIAGVAVLFLASPKRKQSRMRTPRESVGWTQDLQRVSCF